MQATRQAGFFRLEIARIVSETDCEVVMEEGFRKGGKKAAWAAEAFTGADKGRCITRLYG